MSDKNWIVYLLRCSDNSLYCGISTNIEKRLCEHNSGLGAKYTRSRRPVVLVATSANMTKIEAHKLEYRIKQLPADQKISELEDGSSEISQTESMGRHVFNPVPSKITEI